MKSWFNIQHADLYLQKQDVHYIHYPATPEELNKNKPDFIQVENLHSDGIVYIDKATDDMHPGVKSNQLLCDTIHRRLYVRP